MKYHNGFTLAEVFSPHFKNNRQLAFTLAEVLITLGIIGIVAALTIPALVKKYQHHVLYNSLLKHYAIMQTALEKMQADTGITPNSKNYDIQTFKNQYIKHFKVLLDCGLGSTDVTDKVNAKEYCVTEQNLTEEGGRRYTKHYQTYNKKKQIDNSLLNNGQFVLTDGSLILIENWNIGTLYISVDVNGIKNRPNIWGQDLFTFQLMANGKLVPMGMDGTKYPPETHCSLTSTNTENGVACTHRALTDKTFWKNLP